MSMFQQGVCALVAVCWWFSYKWTAGLGLIPRAAVFGVCQAATVAALFVRLLGRSVPACCWLLLKQMLHKPFWS